MYFYDIKEGITTSPCSYTRNMGSTAIAVITKTIKLPVRIGHPSGEPHLNDFVRKAVGRGGQTGDC